MLALITLSTIFSLTFQLCPQQVVDFKVNFIQNGDFQDPVVDPPNDYLRFPGGVLNWTANLAQIGVGTFYNPNWNTGQVASLDSGLSQIYLQDFDISYVGKFLITLNYARVPIVSPSTCGIRIRWNFLNVMQQPSPQSDMIYTANIDVFSIVGLNQLRIDGMGQDDANGTTIDNVGVHPYVPTFLVQINGVCQCANGYFSNGYNIICIPCDLMVPYCATCSFIPDANQLTADCLNNITEGINCTFGEFTCQVCQSGYFLNTTGFCQPIYQFLQGVNTIWYQSCNRFSVDQTIKIPNFKSLNMIASDNTNITIQNWSIEATQNIDYYRIKINMNYLANIADQTIYFHIQYRKASGSLDSETFILNMKRSNVPLVIYSEQQCKIDEILQQYSLFLFITSYLILFISLITFKLAGVQQFGTLQIAFFTLAFHDRVDLYLRAFTKYRLFNGFNVQTNYSHQNMPFSLVNLGYKDNLLFNVNFMLAVLLFDMILAGILYLIYKINKNKLLLTISKYLIRYGFIYLFLFNCLNFSFSISLHVNYTNQQTPLSVLGAIFSIIVVLLFFFAIYLLQFTSQKYFGQYKTSLKQNYANRIYITISIMYRISIGMYTGIKSQQFLGTLFVIAICFIFLMYTIINLPFKKARENYRANLCHITNLITFFATNYYRSMKLNTPIEQRARIHTPSIIQLVSISFCIFVTLIYFIYEIYHKITRCLKSKQTVSQKQKQKQKNNKNKKKQSTNYYNQLSKNNIQNNNTSFSHNPTQQNCIDIA